MIGFLLELFKDIKEFLLMLYKFKDIVILFMGFLLMLYKDIVIFFMGFLLM